MKNLYIKCIFQLIGSALLFLFLYLNPFGLFTIKEFSMKNWNCVTEGMNAEDVTHLLGAPYSIVKLFHNNEMWLYSKNTIFLFFRDFKIFFDEKGYVISKINEISEDCDFYDEIFFSDNRLNVVNIPFIKEGMSYRELISLLGDGYESISPIKNSNQRELIYSHQNATYRFSLINGIVRSIKQENFDELSQDN